MGLFVSVDTQEGNAQGVNPYGCVRENPETATDPTGERVIGCIPGREGCDPSGKPTTKKPAPVNPCPIGPQSFNNCTYSSGMCQHLTFAGCEKLRKEHQAYEDAKRIRDAFQHFSDIFNSLLYIIANIAGSILGFILGPILGGIIAGLLSGFTLLGHLAGDIANAFRQETDQVEMRNGQGYRYFSSGNLESQGQQILGMIGTEGKESVVIGWGAILTSIVGGVSVAVWGPELLSKAANLVKGGVTTGIIAGIVAAVGSIFMFNIVSSDIAQEVNDAP